jgi:hypothetical protein
MGCSMVCLPAFVQPGQYLVDEQLMSKGCSDDNAGIRLQMALLGGHMILHLSDINCSTFAQEVLCRSGMQLGNSESSWACDWKDTLYKSSPCVV